MAKKSKAQSANNQTNEMNNLLAIGAITQEEFDKAEEQAEASELTEEKKNTIIKNTTLNQLLERSKQVRKDVNSLNGVLKSLYKEDIFKNLFEALSLDNYDKVRLAIIKAIAYCSEDVNGNFCAVTLKPICKLSNVTYYKVVKLDWYTAISQATYRLSRGLERVQELTIDNYYQATDNKGIFQDITDVDIIAEIDKQIKIDKYNKAVDRANKLKLEF